MTESRHNQEKLPPVETQLEIVTQFIDDQLKGCESWVSEDYENREVTESEAPMLKTADDSAIFCYSRTVTKGDMPSNVSITVDGIGTHASLEINSDETFYFEPVTSEDVDEYVSREDAFENEDFTAILQSIYRVITEELPKPHREAVICPLPDSITVMESQTNDDTIKVGYAEHPLRGQDAGLVDNKNKLYGVFDGLGEDKCSDVGARLAAKTIQEYVDTSGTIELEDIERDLVEAIKEAHLTILAWSEVTETGATTAAIARIAQDADEQYLVWVSVGDSRIYIKDPNNRLKQQGEDEGEGHTITNGLGRSGLFRGVTWHGIVKLEPRSTIVLVTDGITGDKGAEVLSDQEILDAIDDSLAPNPTTAANDLIDVSRKHDDKTVIVVKI